MIAFVLLVSVNIVTGHRGCSEQMTPVLCVFVLGIREKLAVHKAGNMPFDMHQFRMLFSKLDNFTGNSCIISERIAKERNLVIGDTLSIIIAGQSKTLTIAALSAPDGIFYNDQKETFIFGGASFCFNLLGSANSPVQQIRCFYICFCIFVIIQHRNTVQTFPESVESPFRFHHISRSYVTYI